jgi:hypothetical protein
MNYFTVEELIEKLKTLPPDSIPIIERLGPAHNFVIPKDSFIGSECKHPYFGNDNFIDLEEVSKYNEKKDEYQFIKKFYVIAGI